ncbi:ketoacyl-synt-domain-containing protein [Ustulina deusta]|nr:ketoacyl-synt-domain-containing protein [Ustulina deusta]
MNGSNTAVFTSSFGDDHRILSLKDPECMSRYAGSGTAPSMLANRLSLWYKLKGPSLSIDTACSSGLVALHLACQSLRVGESSMALVGGSNIISSPEQYLLMSNLSMLSPSSRCYSFDHRANGYGRGEGFGMVVVKRLSDAIRDGNIIRTVIRATGTNHNGKTPSLTSPCSEAQQKLIRDTYHKAGLDLSTTAFVEAHGTGTAMGDPLEARALGSVFGSGRTMGDPLYIGSVKSNIGHLEGASGLAGLIKVIMMLERGIIPPNANFEEPNPEIDTKRMNIAFPRESISWPVFGLRRASVNSFGFGGSNCHIVLEDPFNFLKARGLQGRHLSVDLGAHEQNPATNTVQASAQDIAHLDNSGHELPRLLIWSGSDSKSCSRLLTTYSDFFASRYKDFDFERVDELALLLCTRRSLLLSRCFAIISSPSQLSCLSSIASKPVRAQGPRELVFIFTGQGAQYSKMGEQLLPYTAFTQSLEMSQEYLRGLGCEWDIIDELRRPEGETNIHSPLYSQSLCTALQIALADLLRSFGVRPHIVVGHSSGEIAAAYSIGILEHESAIKLAYCRGQAVDRLGATFERRGAMLAAGLSEDEASRHIASCLRSNPQWEVAIACINSPSSVTLAGDEIAINALETRLKVDGVFVRKLRVSVAYRSPHMEKASSDYRRSIRVLRSSKFEGDRPPAMISSVTGRPVTAGQLLDPGYWVRNMVSPVLFKQAVINLLSAPESERSCEFLDVLEIGPHSALQGPFQDIVTSLKTDTKVH